MSTRIPRFGFTAKNEKAISNSKSNISETGINKENKVPGTILKIRNERLEEAQKDKTPYNCVKVHVPRVAFIKQKPIESSIESTGIKRQVTGKNVVMLNTRANINSMKYTCARSMKDNVKQSSGKQEHLNIIQNLSFRQKSLISERESKLEKSKLKLKKVEEECNQLELSFKTSKSELKLQLEYLEEENQKCIKEKTMIQKFEEESKLEMEKLEHQLGRIELLLNKYRNEIDSFRDLNNELTQKISETEETIKLLSKEVLESEKSIKLYEYGNINHSEISKSLGFPFNNSVEFALKLEKLLNNDKITLNQLEFKLHKFKNKPRFVLRNYLVEIPQTSRMFIFIPSPERNSVVGGISDISEKENGTNIENNHLYGVRTDECNTSGFCINTEKKQIIIGDRYVFEIDKVIEFDETKRPSSLLLTDLSKIQSYLSNIIEGKNIESNCLNNYSRNKNKNIFLKRQSLLCSRTEIESPQIDTAYDEHMKIMDRDNFYEVDITEQKEVEMDILLLVNDLFNSIKLGLDDKIALSNRQNNQYDKSDSFVSPICFANIGMSNTASRKTFWGSNKSRCVFTNELQDSETRRCGSSEFSKIKTPGILHSVIHQIYQNINNSSLINWNLSSNILIQEPEPEKSHSNEEKSPRSPKEAVEEHFEFPGGLKGYLPSLDKVRCFMNSDEDFDHYMDPGQHNYKINNVVYSREVHFIKNSTPRDFISEIYNEIKAYSPSFLHSIDAYDFCIGEKVQQENVSKDLHIIIDLKLEANTGDFSVNSSIMLVDLFVDRNSGIDKYVGNYFHYVKGVQINDNFIQHLHRANSNKNKPLIYTLVHSNI
ncbi:hypothetical protein FG379_003500 [Cryptosporidium bovis]|uniref:uncharacterized protein n=1 Tax=Cryptosporidium bovis TaxID=310047 RepID=UPI003519DEBB|nr:hypothetical protein FG379_003500 [Cryptosporidium bovis]